MKRTILLPAIAIILLAVYAGPYLLLLLLALPIGYFLINRLEKAAPKRITYADIEEVKAKLESGELQVFDTSTFPVNGMTPEAYVQTEEYLQDTANGGFNAAVHQIAAGYVKDGYFHESEFQSAPYFDLPIDGITMG